MMIEFYKAADLTELQEDGLYPVEVDGEPICLAKIDSHIYAFTDNCTHISGPLNEGELKNGVITCPWHMAQFDIRTGKVLRGPARQDIMTYPVKIEDGSVLIGLPPAE
jgi:3-phenylpropionate/trans-cinnamate dioxygenase ferredoxin subunit